VDSSVPNASLPDGQSVKPSELAAQPASLFEAAAVTPVAAAAAAAEIAAATTPPDVSSLLGGYPALFIASIVFAILSALTVRQTER
jgi:hypothetical protein